MREYCVGIWQARYFWTHLALSDLRSRWRRSYLGVFWSVLQPLGMALLISAVFSRLLHTDITTYAPYILSGIIVWDFMVANVTAGSLSFVQADAYIRQCQHPLAIYTLRGVLGSLMAMILASTCLYGWSAVVLPQNIGWSWLATLTLFPVLLLVAWPLSTLLAYIATRFRDLPPAMGLAMQALWFISPVYFEEGLFRRGGLDVLVDYNPVYHILEIARAPLLHGAWPTPTNYAFALGTALALALLCWLVGRRAERTMIFYL
ncbi:ABC transporter permease [Pseudomonas sp. CAN2814]|jgi:lipopolysaccharide transport system permease protein|uniref:ABC transporter permease n=1 Tax=Pseudomonas sp. CAN1 TaxID=3046726 RepID=UPI0026473C56|nr:ABC transporter permease [Pseudomonas sp. CAN1]MDN6857387.1 ABC transporter permease [Pseudomonas sp. CAN1]